MLRQFRPRIVSKDVLLETVYSAIATYLRCGTTVISTKRLNKYVQNLKKKPDITSLSQLEREFQVSSATHCCLLYSILIIESEFLPTLLICSSNGNMV